MRTRDLCARPAGVLFRVPLFQMPAGFDSFGLISIWFTPGMLTESSLSVQRKLNSASVAEKLIFVFSGLHVFAIQPRGGSF